MLRFLSKHITNSGEQKTEDLTDFFSYSKVSLHGFPQKVSCICLDEKLGLLAIGTKEGTLRIVGAEGIEWTTTIEFGLHVAHIYFAEGSGVLMALCDDVRTGVQSFYRCQIVNDKLVLTRFNQTNLKRITCCEMLNREDGNSALLIGTIIGNIYALWIQNLEFVEYLVFLDTALRSIKELEGDRKSINRIELHPEDSGKMFMMFNNKLVVLYDTFQDSIERIFSPSTGLTDICVFASSNQLFCSKMNGAYTTYSLEDDSVEEEISKTPFGPSECTPILKILCAKLVKNNQDIIVFSGGMPSVSYGDRYILSLLSQDKVVVLDFESPVLDFVVLCDYAAERIASALFVLCEQELVVIDLKDQSWPMFALPHFNCIHSSPITTTAIFSNISRPAYTRLCELHQQQSRRNALSKRRWPLKCGNTFAESTRNDEMAWKEATLLFTGHENGCVSIWLTNSLSLSPWITLNTANEFEGFAVQMVQQEQPQGPASSVSEQSGKEEEQEWPPIRKAGVFDSCADDHRLSIVKLVFDVDTAEIVVGGRSGQILVYEPILASGAAGAPYLVRIDMTEGSAEAQPNTRGIRNKNTALPPRTVGNGASTAFSLAFNTLLQFQPVVPVSALTWLANRSLLAAGNEFGYSVCNVETREIILKHSLISSSEIVQISNLDGTLSRFKSVKKSIRQSFRRKRRQADSQEQANNHFASKPAKENGGVSIVEEFRPAEREIAQRATNPNVLSGETPNSLVKVIQVFRCSLSNVASSPRDYLFVGTHGGSVLIHLLLETSAAENTGEKCPLVKEIRLQHHAPIIGMECVQDLLAWRLFVFTEEQIRCFLLPGLKPSRYKCRFTAIEGSRIRRATTVLLKSSKSKRLKNMERFISLITNRGEVYLVSTTNSRRHIHVPFTRTTDAAGINSAVISTSGELFFLRPGGSELQRASISACPAYSAPSPFKDEQFPVGALNNALI